MGRDEEEEDCAEEDCCVERSSTEHMWIWIVTPLSSIETEPENGADELLRFAAEAELDPDDDDDAAAENALFPPPLCTKASAEFGRSALAMTLSGIP